MRIEPLPFEHDPSMRMLQTKIGVGVLIVRDGCVLLGRRIGSHGAGDWAPPGGHLEFGESAESCARREVEEETGLALGTLERAPWTVDTFADAAKHYVTLFVVSRDATGDPVAMEPEKCAAWEWHAWDALPSPLFAPLRSLRALGFDPGA